MSPHYAICGILRKHASWLCGHGYLNFLGFKCSSRKYTCPPCRSRYPSKSVQIDEEVEREKNQNVVKKLYGIDHIIRISNILRGSSWESARERLQKLNVQWDPCTVSQVLKSHPPVEKAWLFFNWVSTERCFKHNEFTYTTMLDVFGEAGRITSMEHVLKTMQEKGIEINVVTCTSVLHWLSKSGDFEGAVKVWKAMKANGCHADVVSYNAYMKILFDNNRAKEAANIYKEMLQAGLRPTCHTHTILMVHLIASGNCKPALEIFAKLEETGVKPDRTMCNILINECCKAKEACAIIQILHYMKQKFFVLRRPIYLKALKTLRMAGKDDTPLRQAHPYYAVDAFHKTKTLKVEEMTSDVNSMVDKGLLIAFLRKKNFAAIECLFSGLVSHNTRLNSKLVSEIIEVCCDHGRTNAALLAFEYSKNMDIDIDQVAYLSLMGVLIRANEFPKILHVVEHMISFKSFREPSFAASLIYRLGQVKELDLALGIFDLLPEESKSTTSYSALINACFSAGNPNKGVETFKTMKQEKIQCASATYTVLIWGLEMCGRVEEARIYRREKRSMEAKHQFGDVVPMEIKLCDSLFAGYLVA